MPSKKASPASTHPCSSTDVDLASGLRTVIRRIDRLLARHAGGSASTGAQFSVLAVVARSGPLRLSELVHREGMHPTMLSRTLSGLERDSVIVREVHPEDGRAVVVRVTKEGADLCGRIKHRQAALVASWTETLDESETKRLRDVIPLLEELVDHLLAAVSRITDDLPTGTALRREPRCGSACVLSPRGC